MATKKAETKVVKATPKKEVKKVVKKEVIVEKETATKKAVAKKVVEKVEVKEPKKVASSTIEELFEAGAHFGHVVKKWNPKMKKYLWGAKNGIHIFDL